MTDQLTARLDRLEKRCRRLTVGATALGVSLAAVVTMGAVAEDEVPDEIKARRITVVDPQGNPRSDSP